MHLHPPLALLVRFADGDESLAVWTRTLVRTHLERCPRCRDVVTRSRAVMAAAARADAPPFDTQAAWSRLQQRADRGDHVLLPSLEAAPLATRRRGRPVAVAAAAVVALAFALRPSSEPLVAGSDHGELAFDSLAVHPGRALPVRYVPSAPLASDDSLLLVAEMHGEARTPSLPADTAVLRRGGPDGHFVTTLEVPRTALVVRFTVQSVDGRRVDDNAGRRWEVVARDSAGRPSYPGLFAQYAMHDRTDWEAGYRIVAAMAHHHPDEPNGWRFLIGKAVALAGPSGRDSVVGAHRAVLAGLHARYRDSSATSTRAWEMAMLASALDNKTVAAFWRQRLLREHPSSMAATQFRVWDITEREPDGRRRIAALDALYAEVGGASPQLLFDGFDAAVRLGDAAALRRWGDRMLLGQPDWGIGVAAEFVKVPALRDEGLLRLRRLVAEHPPVVSTDWPAAFVRGPAATRGARQAQSILQQIGVGLAGTGAMHAAYDTLQRAASLGRNPHLTRRLADVALAVGDSAAAASAWAWLAADPRTAPAAPDSAGRRLGAWMTRPAYHDAVATARRALADEVLATAIRQPLRERIVLQTEDGSPVPLQQRQGARLTVVAFISRHCAPSLDDLASLDSVAQRLKADGIPTIAVVNEKPTAAVRNAYARRGWTGALHFDADGSASRGFRQNGTPAYYIVATEDATARFLARQGRDLLLQAAALAGR